MSGRVVLVTGGTGYLGRRVARRFLDDGDEVLLTSRSAMGAPSAVEGLGPGAERARLVHADLSTDEPFAALADDTNGITHIVHAAAAIRFNVERDLAQRVNVDGTRAVIELARRCPKLEALAHVSSVYSTGLHDGATTEDRYDDAAGFANNYEWSKWAAEQLVLDLDGDLPWRVLRVATVVADDVTGRVTQYNAFHEALKLCFYGLMSVLPGTPDTPLYFVTGDFAAEAIAVTAGGHDAGGIYHVAHDGSSAPTLGELLDVAFASFEQAEDFRKKRILRPLHVDEHSFGLLVAGVTPFAGGLLSQALDNVAPFARQLYVHKDVDNARLRAALPEYVAPDGAQLLRDTCDYLVRTRWGRRDAER
jgi:nucleoside-diphosphate-sugar epimerase